MKVINTKTGYLLAEKRFRITFEMEDGSTSMLDMSEETSAKLALGLLRRPAIPQDEIDPIAVFDTGDWTWGYDDFGDLTVVSEIDTGSSSPTQIGLRVSSLEIDDFAEFLNKMIQDRPTKMQPQ